MLGLIAGEVLSNIVTRCGCTPQEAFAQYRSAVFETDYAGSLMNHMNRLNRDLTGCGRLDAVIVAAHLGASDGDRLMFPMAASFRRTFLSMFAPECRRDAGSAFDIAYGARCACLTARTLDAPVLGDTPGCRDAVYGILSGEIDFTEYGAAREAVESVYSARSWKEAVTRALPLARFDTRIPIFISQVAEAAFGNIGFEEQVQTCAALCNADRGYYDMYMDTRREDWTRRTEILRSNAEARLRDVPTGAREVFIRTRLLQMSAGSTLPQDVKRMQELKAGIRDRSERRGQEKSGSLKR